MHRGQEIICRRAQQAAPLQEIGGSHRKTTAYCGRVAILRDGFIYVGEFVRNPGGGVAEDI